MRLASEYATRHMLSNGMLKEYPVTQANMSKVSKVKVSISYSMGQKVSWGTKKAACFSCGCGNYLSRFQVFCSQWLSHKQVIFGTKCNKLMVLDVNTRHMDQIPSLQSSENSVPPDQECGIHSIEINPSRTLLATGARNSNDVAVYRLPTLDPICVGENAHTDWIFDQTWLDDQFLVSGSRDGTLALWRVTDEMIEQVSGTRLVAANECPPQVTSADIPSYLYSKPLQIKKCKQADRVRSLCYNDRTQEIAVVSLNGYIHCWNAVRMKQVMSKRLPHTLENVCLSTDEECQLYAVGSKVGLVSFTLDCFDVNVLRVSSIVS